MPEPVSKVRHWKQRFRPEGPFRWRRLTLYDGETYRPGEPVAADLLSRVKARRFWRSGRIEMADFLAPDIATGSTPAPPSEFPRVEAKGGGYFLVFSVPGEEPEQVRGREAADERLAALREEAAA
jgi:hypothetical protein